MRLRSVLLILQIVFILILLIMQISVYSINKEIINYFKNGEKSQFIKDEVYESLYFVQEYANKNYDIEVKVEPLFCICIGSNGHIWYRYTYKVKKDGDIVHGSSNAPCRIDIKKDRGKWYAIELKQRP